MAINKPIFILGSGRSGTTVFYNFLSTHPQLCWYSNLSNRFLKIAPAPLLHRILDLPFVGTRCKKNIIANRRLSIKPSEAGKIYHDHCGFKYDIQTTETDLEAESEKRFKQLINRHLRLSGKKRFLTKQTANNQRIRIIDKMFKDAYFIHVIRDGRAVANSMLRVSWWDDTDIWWLGKTPAEWKKNANSPIELCGLHWKKDVAEILDNRYLFEDRYIEIKYEDFIADVWGSMKTITRFCELQTPASFYKNLPQTLPDMNQKWQEYLTDEEKDILNTTLKPFLTQLGYDC